MSLYVDELMSGSIIVVICFCISGIKELDLFF